MWRAAAVLFLLTAMAGPAQARCSDGDGDWVKRVCYDKPLTRDKYGHDILGGTPEWTEIDITLGPQGRSVLSHRGGTLQFRLTENNIFEDVAPRLADMDGDGRPELIAVQTNFDQGARLMVIGLDGSMAPTPYIGRSNRWLAPIGAADLDGDGFIEIAYVDRPHLARLIRVWRFKDGALELAGELPGYTNHRIGEDTIAGGIRDCGSGPELIVADAGWREIFAIRFSDGKFSSQALAPHQGRSSFSTAMTCQN